MANVFISAMNQGSKFTTTTNGADSFTECGVENPLVALSFKLVRDLKQETLVFLMQKVLDTNGNKESIIDLFVLSFQTRDVRGGKGERLLFYQMFLYLFDIFGLKTLVLLRLIPHYGSYKDLREIWGLIPNSGNSVSSVTSKNNEILKKEIVRIFAEQLILDRDTPIDQSISLAGKWAPREKSEHHSLAKALSAYLFGKVPNSNTNYDKEGYTGDTGDKGGKNGNKTYQARKEYRNLLTGLNKRLNTIENLMCNGKWSDIDPGSVPARNLMIHRKAFMNVDKKGAKKSNLDDRETCAKQFAEFMEKSKLDSNSKKLHGEILHPHELVKEYLQKGMKGPKGRSSDLTYDPILEAQFESMCYKILHPETSIIESTSVAPVASVYLEKEGVASVYHEKEGVATVAPVEAVVKGKEEGQEKVQEEAQQEGQGQPQNEGKRHSILSKMCVMLDTSGSMQSGSGKIPPILPAMGLTALITRINHPVFRNFYIRFSEEAEMMRYAKPDENPSLCDILNYMAKDGKVANTNFQKAYELILRLCIEHKVPEEDLPEYLLVLSDMQFDAAITNVCINYAEPYVASNKASFTPHYELIQKKFRDAGYSKAPKILFWNLNGNTKDYPAQSDTIGVEMISGFSGAVLKYFMEGNITAQVLQNTNNTPYMTLRKQLDDERYLAVREILNEIILT